MDENAGDKIDDVSTNTDSTSNVAYMSLERKYFSCSCKGGKTKMIVDDSIDNRDNEVEKAQMRLPKGKSKSDAINKNIRKRVSAKMDGQAL